ncbi:MAG: hypothetical protein ACOYM8_18545 [Caulobacterales bacterium]
MSAPPFDLKKAIADHRAAKAAKAAKPDRPLAGLAALAVGSVESESSPCADEIERAAIAEHEGGLPRGWADALAAVAHHEKPPGKSGEEWARLMRAAWAFADRHGGTLDAAGWTFAEIFGEPRAWFGQRGAAWLFDQGLLEAVALEIGADAIRWRAPSGRTLTKWKAGRSPGVTIGNSR